MYLFGRIFGEVFLMREIGVGEGILLGRFGGDLIICGKIIY
jgi:hypothetical protein